MADDDEDTEEYKKFETMFNKFFHKAAGERDRRLEKNMKKMFEEGLGGKFDELRMALLDNDVDEDDVIIPDTPVQPGQSGQPPAQPGNIQMSPEMRAELRRAQQVAKEANEKAEKFAKQYETEAAARRRQEERQTLTTLLSPHVKPKLLDIVVDRVHGQHLHRDPDTDQLLWKDENGETLPLKDGAAAWAKSDVGKEFAPPVEARGRGGRGPDGGGAIQPGKMTIETLGDIVAGSIPGQGRH